MSICQNCGTENRDGMLWCVNCGYEIEAEVQRKEQEKAEAERLAKEAKEAEEQRKLQAVQAAEAARQAEEQRKQAEIRKQIQSKSFIKALLLTFFFGPLGLFYVNSTHAIIMTALSWGLWFVFSQHMLPISDFASDLIYVGITFAIWIIGLVLAFIDVKKHNNSL